MHVSQFAGRLVVNTKWFTYLRTYSYMNMHLIFDVLWICMIIASMFNLRSHATNHQVILTIPHTGVVSDDSFVWVLNLFG